MMPKWDALGSKNSNIPLELLQNMTFERLRKLIEKGCQNGSKIEPWALLGRIFEILGCLLRRLIFDEFSVGKKSTKNPTFEAQGLKTEQTMALL